MWLYLSCKQLNVTKSNKRYKYTKAVHILENWTIYKCLHFLNKYVGLKRTLMKIQAKILHRAGYFKIHMKSKFNPWDQ